MKIEGLTQMSVTYDKMLHMSFHPSNSTRKSCKWCENNLPMKKIIRRLTAKRVQFGLSMENVLSIKKCIKEGRIHGHTWGREGDVQIFVMREDWQ